MSRRAGFSPVSNLIGKTVRDQQGQVVGRVREFLVDEADGRIAYVEFDFRRDKAGPDRRITVPWSTIRHLTGSEWRLGVDRSTLDSLSRPYPI